MKVMFITNLYLLYNFSFNTVQLNDNDGIQNSEIYQNAANLLCYQQQQKTNENTINFFLDK